MDYKESQGHYLRWTHMYRRKVQIGIDGYRHISTAAGRKGQHEFPFIVSFLFVKVKYGLSFFY